MDFLISSKKNTRWFYLGLLMVLVYLWHGYQFGQNDQTEWLPYSIHLNNQHVYSTDLYLNYITQQWPNERWFLSKIVSWTVPFEQFFSFIFHLIFFLILLLGLWKITSEYLSSPVYQFIAILILLVLMAKTDLGGNEIYYNYLVSSLPAKSLGTWAIWLVLKNQFIRATILLIIATYFQTLVGIQLFVLLFGVAGIQALYRKKFSKYLLGSIGLYILLCGWWIVGLVSQTASEEIISFTELIQFRVPHHFMPTTFGFENYLIYLGLIVVSLIIFLKQKWYFPLLFFGLILVGCTTYTFFIYVFDSELILKTQWFKTTLWLEIWFSISITYLLQKFSQQFKLKNIHLQIGIGFMVMAAMVFSFTLRNPSYDFPSKECSEPEIQIAQVAKRLSPPNALFIIPFGNTTFRYWSQRNVYVDFKSVLHSNAYLNKWYHRLGIIYGLTLNESFNPSTKNESANYHYNNLTKNDLINLNVDYILTTSDHLLDFEILTSNEKWIIYKIKS